ncbi:hypothetical protein FND55_06445 [Lactobacillus paracasei subsp. paracasei]|uniref:transmembrane-type terpene cyclase n=1 Tax=Lacticaseibacillus paracasei TaxID=1597 RepID=UPI0018C5FE6C|nr:hypothetical protein [Lacticaseibacillus paracasei]MBG1273262.1 hypothetical protein [Lacticaseibacillus paracasei subsp. paracasei]
MALALTLISGISWTLVYYFLIRKGFKEHTYGMPLWALGLNIAWETTYGINGFIHPNGSSAQSVINIIWALCDVLIVVTYLKYGRKYQPVELQNHYRLLGIFVLVVSFIVQILLLNYFGVHTGARLSAYLQNLLMSILFLNMLFIRHGVEGQSVAIGITKFIGTLAPTILMGVIEPNPLVLTLGILCAIFDILYIILLMVKQKLIAPK